MSFLHSRTITIHAPMTVTLHLILQTDGSLVQLHADRLPAVLIEALQLQRAICFVERTLATLEGRGGLIDDLYRHLKGLPGFEMELALVRAVDNVQAAFWSEQTAMKRGAA